MNYRPATLADVPALALLNQQLIRDEGARNRRTLKQLEDRMAGWLASDYRGILLETPEGVAGYALYRLDPDDIIYLRQFFICPEFRRRGLGRIAMQWLRENTWKNAPKIRLEVLVHNSRARAFWQSLGFIEYSITMEIPQP